MDDEDPPAVEPVRDGVTLELVRDAIGVARGEVPAERFSAKYGTGRDAEGAGEERE